MQKIFANYETLSEFLLNITPENKNILFVHGKSLQKISVLNKISDKLKAKLIHFTEFKANPKIKDALKAAECFTLNNCSNIFAVGGGSSIDIAKYAKLQHKSAKLAVIPTTAGSGSEATRFAVLYEDGRKLSITDDDIIPDAVLFDSELLQFLPEYHRKSSALDALSHALESFWSVNADETSMNFSREALGNITRLLENYPGSYNPEAMLINSYTAGRAINIARTTAGHAMCYKITGIFGISHGHSAALCNKILFRWLAENANIKVSDDIAKTMNCRNLKEAALKFESIYNILGLEVPEANEGQINMLASSVNPERLKNFPVSLDESTIKNLYRKILRIKAGA